MADETSLYRIFKLIRLLNTPPPKPAKQLWESLGRSSSQFYRDIKLLDKLGYPVDTDLHDRWYLQFQFEKGKKGILEPEELFFLQEHLQRTGGASPLAQSILHKFDRNLSMIPLADALPQLHSSRILQLIRIGIEMQRCLLLRGYHSLASQTQNDRRIEPLEITLDHRYLIAWDLDKGRQSQFKLSRIQDVDILDEKATPGRTASPMDIFGLTGDEWRDVKMKLSSLAHHLLLEEFPSAQPDIKHRREGVFFEGRVRSWKGIGRFVLGLPGEIEVVGPEGFKKYLRERIKGWQLL